MVEAPQRLACTNVSDSYLVVPYSSPKVRHHNANHISHDKDLLYCVVRPLLFVVAHHQDIADVPFSQPMRICCPHIDDNTSMTHGCCMQFAEESTGQTAEARSLTMFFMASCTDDMTYNVKDFGMKMRLHMVQRLGDTPAPDIFVKCANEHRVSGCTLPPALCGGGLSG